MGYRLNVIPHNSAGTVERVCNCCMLEGEDHALSIGCFT